MLEETQYRQLWQTLNGELQRIEVEAGNLGGALDALYEHQLATGFVRDDLSNIKRYAITHPDDTDYEFWVQFNPRRADRFGGCGRKEPPPGLKAANDGCVLCPVNIWWQQGGIEIGYETILNDRDYIAWMNPYPLASAHAVIASRAHLSQGWAVDNTASGSLRIDELIADLVALVRRLPGYLAFYNGIGAGASIPNHLHYHAFRRAQPAALFPIERLTDGCDQPQAVFTDGYPVHFAYWQGGEDEVVSRAVSWASDWVRQGATDGTELSANIMAMGDGSSDLVQLYFVPRSRLLPPKRNRTGLIGGLEMLGELVFCSDDEKRRLDAGEIDYFTVDRILADVCVPLRG